MLIRIHRTDGKTGRYSQDNAARAAQLVKRLDPRTLFRSGPIVIGVINPFTLLNPDEVCWVEVETALETLKLPQPGVEEVRRLSGRAEYEELLARRWGQWMKYHQSNTGDLLEACVQLSFRGGGELYLHVIGQVADQSLSDCLFSPPALTAVFAPHGTLYINPKCLVRARVYHSRDRVVYPSGIWVAEADDI